MSETFQRPEEFSETVVVYGTTMCGFCAMAKSFLRKREVPYAWVDVAGNSQARDWLREVSGQRTVPQIFVHQRSVGGYSDLRALDERGELDTLLKG